MKLRIGMEVSVEGRFIPESKMGEITKNEFTQSYPQVGFDGKITLIQCYSVFVQFDSFEMEIPKSDLVFPI